MEGVGGIVGAGFGLGKGEEGCLLLDLCFYCPGDVIVVLGDSGGFFFAVFFIGVLCFRDMEGTVLMCGAVLSPKLGLPHSAS